MRNYLLIGFVLVVCLAAGMALFSRLSPSHSNRGRAATVSYTSEPTSSTLESTPAPALANPASVNCIHKGGTLVTKTRGDEGQYSLCQFEDNMACEEWALFRGDCPVGGIKTTGFDTEEQRYCAWLGGQTLAIKNATCTLPDKTVCTDKKLYNGTCP